MTEIPRLAAILKPTTFMLNWINSYGIDDAPFSLEEIRSDCTVILLPTDFTDENEANAYLNDVCETLFASELAAWNTDENTWPVKRDIETFFEWFELEFHSTVIDLGDVSLEDSEEEDDEDEEAGENTHTRYPLQ